MLPISPNSHPVSATDADTASVRAQPLATTRTHRMNGAQLTGRDWRLLGLLYDHRVLTGSQIAYRSLQVGAPSSAPSSH
jgi:hypothetical protein